MLITTARRRAPLAALLRLAALGLVLLSVCGLSLETREGAQDLCIVLAEDVSASVGAAGERLEAELARDLVPRLRPTDQLGGVAFARQAEVVAWPAAPPRPPSFARVKLDPSATRLSSGIELAVPLCPEGSEKKIVLLTDGNETIGEARRAVALAREGDVQVYVAVPGSGGAGGLYFEKLTAPPMVREGSVFPLRAIVRSGFAQPKNGSLDIFVHGELAAHETVHLDPGINVFEVPYQLHERGSVEIAARLFGEGLTTEERRETSLAVAGPIRALVISHSRDSALAKALRLREVDLEFRDPPRFPKLEELLQYHCVILDDVPRKELPDEALEVLESYVKSFGGGFLMTGGPRSFGDKAYQKSAVERILPVNLVEQPPKGKGRAPMGVFLVIDRSNSMGYNSRRHDVRDGEKMRYAREAALALVEQLRPEDRVGVIAFDSDPYVLGPLRALSEQRAVLEDRIARLVPGGGTDFKAALEIATAQLVQSGLPTLHVILLTDGDTNRGPADHAAVIAAMSRLGISVTTIRIGDDDVNLEFLQQISRDTGGHFYHVEDIEHLPQLIVSDARRVQGEKGEAADATADKAPAGSAVRPAIGESTEVVRGLVDQEFPVVRDVPPTKLKGGADLVLYVNDGGERRPLLVTWLYGLGRAAAFPFDSAQPEAGGWAAWPGFAKLWSQLVRWAIREEAPWETRQAVRFRDGNPYLEVQTFDDIGEGNIEAQVFTSPERSLSLTLTPVSPRIYRAPLPPLATGKYALLLTRRAGEQILGQKREVLAVEGSADEGTSAELARKLPDLELLREIVAETGGSLNPSIDELVARHGAKRLVRHDLDWLLIPLALALMFADIALRMRTEA
ncbi:MAG TPA: VWA domain-containing protein [Candidatus Binatia bacterium]|nr:VWA domain-containing protein [Candidatus Binatia bacterium]